MITRKPIIALLATLAITLTPPIAFANSTGCIVQGVEKITDPAVSVYVGGNLIMKNGSRGGVREIEGSMIVDGNLTDANGYLAGKVMWGMGFEPPANSTMLNVGGNITIAKSSQAISGGYVRVGGTAPVTGTNILRLVNRGDHQAYWYPQKTPTILQKLGKTEALQADTDGDFIFDTDYNGYVEKTLKPLSSQLAALPTTGTVSFSKAADVNDFVFWGANGANYAVNITNEGLITFTGDNQTRQQIFNLDVNQLEAKKTSLKVKQWSFAFNNIPDGQPIIINVTGRTTYNWNTGWRIWVNGKEAWTNIDARNETLSRFRAISSRIIWNYPQTTNLTMDYAHGNLSKDAHTGTQFLDKGQEVYDTWAGKGALFPGSILLPNGNLTDIADTNGRILVGKNLTLDIWEHHNAPWIGMPDTPQCFTVNGKTTATIS